MASIPNKKQVQEEASDDPDAMEGVEEAVPEGPLRNDMSVIDINKRSPSKSAPTSRYGLRDRSARKRYFRESESPPSAEEPPSADESSYEEEERKIAPKVKRRKKESVSSAARKPEASDKKVTIEAKAGNCTFEPPAWASCKAELLQSFGKLWYNAPYKITHTNKAEYGVIGYLMDANSGCRYIDEEILIIGMNGGFKQNSEGKWILETDQTEENCQVNYWEKNRDNERPIGLVVGDQCEVMKQELAHRLNIMDFFMVTDIWEELENGHNRFSARLQKLDLTNKSWWAKNGTPNPPAERDFTPLEKRKCTPGEQANSSHCNELFPQIYKVGWMCLNRNCDQFWRIDGVRADSAETLEFDEKFLSWRKEFDVQKCLDNAWHPLIPKIDLSKDDSHTRRDGIICPDCNRCIPRVYIGNWQCDIDWPVLGGVEPMRQHEAGCKWAHKLLPKVTKLNDEQLQEIETAYTAAKRRGQTTGYAKWQNELKDVYGRSMGKVTHFISNKSINKAPNGPDDLFELLQTNCHTLGLRRLRGAAPRIAGMMSNNFLRNVGIPYDFQIPMGTASFKDFDEENPGVMHAFARLDWAFREASKDDPYPYTKANELLFIGYQEGQELKWHDDGHGSLGPQIATFCLGSECIMKFRIKPDYYFGLDEKGEPIQKDVILEGCLNADVRKELLEKYESKAITKAEYDRERKARLKRSSRGFGKVLRPYVYLRHGDIVVMNGEDTQTYYEHCVESIPGMRFAITARHVFPDFRSVKRRLERQKLGLDVGEYVIKPEELFDGTK